MHELDQTLLRRANNLAAAGYDDNDFFCKEVGERLLGRLELVELQPTHILDLGAGTGTGAKALQSTYPEAVIVALDWSESMLRAGSTERICGDAHQLPLGDATIDIVVSNMMLPGCANPEQIFHEARRVLRYPGLFLFSTLGPDTLKELRKAWARVDNAPHVHNFADMHNVGDALVQAGFRDPVMDVEHVTVTYGQPEKLATDLRAVAGTNLLASRRRGLTTPRQWDRMLGELEKGRDQDGRLPVTIEVITGQAWAGKPDPGVTMYAGEARIPVSDIITHRKQD
jgi:malonyl-CoA O-methyltransferase